MAYAKIISTGFGVTIATLHVGSFAHETQTGNCVEGSYTGNVINIPSIDIKAIDLYRTIHPSTTSSDDPYVNIYQQHMNGSKTVIQNDDVINADLWNSSFSPIFYFENTRDKGTNNHDAFRMGALISGGPDGIIASSLMKAAGNLEDRVIDGYDFFYIKSGRPSDWQEYNAVEQFLQNNFNENSFNLHVIDVSPQKTRLVLCGENESTYNRFGLSSALSLVAAKCETLINKPNIVLFGIHGADARFKARESNEYTRHFIDSWNRFWKSFYPSSPLFIAPLIDVFDKIDILKMSKPLGINLKNTWSCYLGGKNHCGECKSCLERRLAYKIAKLTDPTEYSNVPEIGQLQNRVGWVSFEKNNQWQHTAPLN